MKYFVDEGHLYRVSDEGWQAICEAVLDPDVEFFDAEEISDAVLMSTDVFDFQRATKFEIAKQLPPDYRQCLNCGKIWSRQDLYDPEGLYANPCCKEPDLTKAKTPHE